MFATIVFFVVLVLVLGFKMTMMLLDRRAISDASLGRAATFSGITIADATITRHGTSQSLAGISAVVETVGELQRRVTLTRVATFGVFALAMKKKVDARELCLTITGPTFQWVVELPGEKGPLARQFAAAVNTRSLAQRGSVRE